MHAEPPIGMEAVKGINALFAVEREINGLSADDVTKSGGSAASAFRRFARLARRATQHVLTLAARREADRLHAQALDSFASFLDNGRACLSRILPSGRPEARKARLFSGTGRGAERAAAMGTLIQTAKMNGVDPQGLLADVLARIAEMTQGRLQELLPWSWRTHRQCPNHRKAA